MVYAVKLYRGLQRQACARDVPLSRFVYLAALFSALLVDHYWRWRGECALRLAGIAAYCARASRACDPQDVANSRRPTSPASSFGRDFALTDHNGKPRTLADFRGKAVVVFFGYTQCPDVCPTTLAMLAETMKQLGPDADRVQVLFVTVDPERDTR